MLIPRIKRQEREADHSPPYSAEVKNEWSYTSIHSYILMPYSGTTLHLLHINFYVCILFCLYFLYNYCVTLKQSQNHHSYCNDASTVHAETQSPVIPVRTRRKCSTPHSRQRELVLGLYVTPTKRNLQKKTKRFADTMITRLYVIHVAA